MTITKMLLDQFKTLSYMQQDNLSNTSLLTQQFQSLMRLQIDQPERDCSQLKNLLARQFDLHTQDYKAIVEQKKQTRALLAYVIANPQINLSEALDKNHIIEQAERDKNSEFIAVSEATQTKLQTLLDQFNKELRASYSNNSDEYAEEVEFYDSDLEEISSQDQDEQLSLSYCSSTSLSDNENKRKTSNSPLSFCDQLAEQNKAEQTEGLIKPTEDIKPML